MNKERFYQLIETCMKQNDVREAVLENHDNNRWWPDDVRDRRKRLIIGGLSSRISYNMIHTYQEVIRRLDHYSYEEIRCMEDKEIAELIKPLG